MIGRHILCFITLIVSIMDHGMTMRDSSDVVVIQDGEVVDTAMLKSLQRMKLGESSHGSSRTILVTPKQKTDLYVSLYRHIFNGELEEAKAVLAKNGYPAKNFDIAGLVCVIDENKEPDLVFALSQKKSPFWFAVFLKLMKKGKGDDVTKQDMIKLLFPYNHDINEVGFFCSNENAVTMLRRAVELEDWWVYRYLLPKETKLRASGSSRSSQRKINAIQPGISGQTSQQEKPKKKPSGCCWCVQ